MFRQIFFKNRQNIERIVPENEKAQNVGFII